MRSSLDVTHSCSKDYLPFFPAKYLEFYFWLVWGGFSPLFFWTGSYKYSINGIEHHELVDYKSRSSEERLYFPKPIKNQGRKNIIREIKSLTASTITRLPAKNGPILVLSFF